MSFRAVKLCLLVLAIFSITLAASIAKMREIPHAQTDILSTGMNDLIERLDQRTKDEPGFAVSFRFVVPLLEEELYWTIPFSDQEAEIERWIGEVGENYLCFYELAGQAEIGRCTPFSNIAVITFLSGP